MILYALTVVVLEASNLSSAVSALFLTFLVPSVLFSALAGVYVDRIDRRVMLVVTNALRALVLVGHLGGRRGHLHVLLLNTVFSIVTVFFAPAEAAMIPVLVPREQLVAANGLFTLTLNGAFALGYALLGPLDRDDRRWPAAADHHRRRPVRPGGRVLRRAPARPTRTARPRPRERSRRRGRPGRHGCVRPAGRGHRVHPREPCHRLVPRLPRHLRVADRRGRRPGAVVRSGHPRASARRT